MDREQAGGVAVWAGRRSITGRSEFCFFKSIQGQGKKTAVKKAGLVSTLYDLKQLNKHRIAVTGKQREDREELIYS